MHLTDEQLNEYLDNEIADRSVIELHLASCEACTERLSALRALFAEIESLPELELTRSIADRFLSTSERIPLFPRWLTLAAALQALLALIVLIAAAPIITRLFPGVETPSLAETWVQLQSQWMTWLDLLSAFWLASRQALQFPSLPSLPTTEIPNLVLAITLAGVCLLWLMGNGLLLRRQRK